MDKLPKIFTPVTDEDMRMAQALARCNYLPGSPDRRFCKDAHWMTQMTEAQRAYLRRCFWRYRRQHGLPAEKPAELEKE